MISSGSFPDGHDPLAGLAGLPGVATALAQARTMVDQLLGHRILRTRTAAVAEQSALRGARASAELDGAAGSLAVPLELLVAGATSLSPALAGALRVHAELPRLRAVWRSSPRQALARLHLLAAAGLTQGELLGRPSGDPYAAAALARIAAVARADTSAPALVVAAVVHGDLLVAAPFAGGNGVVARAASRLVLADRGLDQLMLTTPEVGQLEVGGCDAALAAYREGSPAGVASWLVHCAESVRAGARDSLAVAEAMLRG